jgi:hypothetical protein
MWHKFGLAALIALWLLAPAGAQGQQYFSYPRYRLPGSPSPSNFVNDPPGRVSPFPANPGYLSPVMNPFVGNNVAPAVRGWVYAGNGGGVFQNNQQGVWTAYPNAGNAVNYLELYRTPSYAELYQPATGAGVRITNNMLYRDYSGVWYPVMQGWWQ